MKANSPMGKKYCAELLTKLVDIPSTFPREEEVMLFLECELTTLGLRPERIEVEEGRFNLLCRIGSGAKRICLNAHADTVPPNGESTPKARVDGDILHGLGSCDDKASIAAIVTAGLELASRADELSYGVDVLISVDEEDGAKGVETAIDKGYKCDFAVVGEPTNLDIVRTHNGLTWFGLVAKGVAAHGSAPWAGVSAIQRMMQVVDELKEAVAAFPPNPLTGPNSLNLGIIRGGDLVNRVPETCEAMIDIRVAPPQKLDEIDSVILPILNSREWLCYEQGKRREGLDTPESSPLVHAVLESARELGRDPRIMGGRGWMEAESFRTMLGIDAIVCGPGSMQQAHSSNEFVSISETQLAAELYVRTIEKLMGAG